MADVTIANIVLQKPQSQELASAFRVYAMQNAELVAKKELALMGLAINNAAAKGSTSIDYKLSRDFTTLQGDFYNRAVEIINADLDAAGYGWNVVEKAVQRSGRTEYYAVGFKFVWGDEDVPTPPADSDNGEVTVEEEWNELQDPEVNPEQTEPVVGE